MAFGQQNRKPERKLRASGSTRHEQALGKFTEGSGCHENLQKK